MGGAMLEHTVAPGLVVQGAKGRGTWWPQVGGCMMCHWLRPPRSTAINCVVPGKRYWGAALAARAVGVLVSSG